MPARSATSRKWRAGALPAGRAAAFLTLVTGVNLVLAVFYPRYEPIYVYLISVVVIAWLGSALIGVTAAVAAAIVYDWMFSPVHVVPSVSFAIPVTIAVAVAIATRAARIPLQQRPALAEPVKTPLLPVAEQPVRVDVIVDETRVRELEDQVAGLKRQLVDARFRADDQDNERAAEIESLRQKITEHGGRVALMRRENDTLAQQLTESEARANEASARAEAKEAMRSAAVSERAAEIESLTQKVIEHGGRASQLRRENETLTQRLAETETRANAESARADALQRTMAEVTAKHEAAAKRAEAMQTAAVSERARADRQSGEYAQAIAERQKQSEAAAAQIRALQLELDRTLASLNSEHARADREAQLRAQLEIAARETLNRTAVVSSTHQREASQALEAARVAEERARELQRQFEQESLRVTFESAARQKVADEAAVLRKELESARAGAEAELRMVTEHAEQLQRAIEEQRAKLQSQRDEMNREFDANLQKIVANLASDHENAVGEALTATQAAKAELRSVTNQLADAKRQIESQREQLDRESAASTEVLTLRQQLEDARRQIESQRELLNEEFDGKLQKIVAGLTTDYENAIGDAVLEREAARAELRRVTKRTEELARRASDEKAERERLDAEWNTKLQKIVAHLTEDHEADIGEAMLQREAARAEVRNLTAKVAALQKHIEDDREKFRQAFTRRTTMERTMEKPLPATAAVTEPMTRPHVILVVHSDAGVRAMAKHTLQQSGYIVLTAADGLEGLRTATQQKPDVVLAQTTMPKMNARELVQLLKSKRETADVKIVLMTTTGDVGSTSDFTADEVVNNPADFNELRTTLANVLARART